MTRSSGVSGSMAACRYRDETRRDGLGPFYKQRVIVLAFLRGVAKVPIEESHGIESKHCGREDKCENNSFLWI